MEQKTNIDRYLNGCEFPCDRSDLERAARKNDAPENVMQQIRQLPERRFESQNAVREAVGQGQARGQTTPGATY